MLNRIAHHGWGMPAKRLDLHLQAKTFCSTLCPFQQDSIQPSEFVLVRGTELQRYIHSRRDNIECARHKLHIPDIDNTMGEILYHDLPCSQCECASPSAASRRSSIVVVPA